MPPPSTAALKKPRKLDIPRLLGMTPPLTLRAERRVNGGQMPILLPPGQDGAEPGAGFDVASVQTIEKWLLTECGGGIYDLSCTDIQGQTMDWTTAFDPKTFPPKVPTDYMESASIEAQNATLQQVAAQSVVQQQQAAPQPMMQQQMPEFVFDPTTGGVSVVQPQPAPMMMAPPVSQVPMTQLRPSYAWPSFFPQTQIPQQVAANDRSEIRALEAKLHENEMKAIEQRNAEALREQQRMFEQRMQAMTDQLARTNNDRATTSTTETMMRGFEAILTSIKTLAESKPAGPSTELLQMKEEMREAREENKRLREQSEARERERAAQEQHRREMDTLREHMRATEERFTQLITELKARPTGPDPVLAVMQENTRMMIDAMRQTTTVQDQNLRQLSQQIMSPADLMRLMKDSSNGADVLTRNVAGAYNDLFGMFRDMSQHMSNMSGAGSEPPIVGVVKDVAAQVGGLADKWVSGQRDTAIAAAQVEKAKIDASVAVVRAQQQPVYVTAPPPNNGVQPSLPQPPPQPPPHVSIPQGPVQAAATSATGAPNGVTKRLGHTDIEWFTPVLLPHIEELRREVAIFMDAVTSNPKKVNEKGELHGVNPMQATNAILTAAHQIQENKVDIPAFTQLFMQGRYADLFDVVLPNAPQVYRDDCVQLINAHLNPSVAPPTLATMSIEPATPSNGANGSVKVPANVQPVEDEDADADDDDDVSEEVEVDENGEPEEDGVPTPTPPTRSSGRRGGPTSTGTKKRVSA